MPNHVNVEEKEHAAGALDLMHLDCFFFFRNSSSYTVKTIVFFSLWQQQTHLPSIVMILSIKAGSFQLLTVAECDAFFSAVICDPGDITKVHLSVVTDTYVVHILLFLHAVPDLFDDSLYNIWLHQMKFNSGITSNLFLASDKFSIQSQIHPNMKTTFNNN